LLFDRTGVKQRAFQGLSALAGLRAHKPEWDDLKLDYHHDRELGHEHEVP